MKYNVNHKNKTVTINRGVFENMSPEELESVVKYKTIGYDIVIKEPNRERLTKKDILKALESNAEDTEQFNTLLKEQGFFAAKNWYKEKYLPKKEKKK